LFMIAGIVGKLGGSFELARLGGLYQERPGFSIVFLLAALSLIGIPPLSGFWAKLLIIDAGLHHDSAVVITFVVLVSLLTFIPLIRIWSEVFWKPKPLDADVPSTAGSVESPNAFAWTPVLGLSAIMLAIGFLPAKIIDMSDTAAKGLITRTAYVDAVLPARAKLNEAQK
jgi:multicomponent Na+:H+ antiporter subunit D